MTSFKIVILTFSFTQRISRYTFKGGYESNSVSTHDTSARVMDVNNSFILTLLPNKSALVMTITMMSPVDVISKDKALADDFMLSGA